MGTQTYWGFVMSIQQRLITLRKERDLTQQEMADAIGVQPDSSL